MRPIVSEQDPLRYPLNELLGTQANVRLLRVMAIEVDGPLTTSDVAKRAGLTLPGAQKALGKLFRSGFISRVGGGRKHQYEIRRSGRLMLIVSELFRVEKDQYENLLAGVKKEIENLTPHPHAAWVQSSPTEVGEPLTLGVLHETRHLMDCMRQLRSKIDDVENEFDVTIEIEGYTKADILDLELDGVTTLYGVMPSLHSATQKQAKRPLTHREKDHRLHVLSRKLVEAVEQDTSLVRRAKEHIERLLTQDRGTATKDIMEWRDILDKYSIQRLTQFLTSSSERANRLRQSNPFFAILTVHERDRLINELEDKNDT